ncbi:MAG: hypothetical protein ACI4WF_01680 [Bacilli bacterium]
MTISYLLSILDLYLLKEKDSQLLIEVDNEENLVRFNFTYSFDSINKTFVKINKNLFFTNLKEIILKIQSNLKLKEEKYEIKNNKNIYTFNYEQRRIITFIGFSKKEMLKIRESFNDLSDNFDFNINDSYDQILVNKPEKLQFSMGFSNYMSLFLSSIFFLDILMISLWIFKAFLR